MIRFGTLQTTRVGEASNLGLGFPKGSATRFPGGHPPLLETVKITLRAQRPTPSLVKRSSNI